MVATFVKHWFYILQYKTQGLTLSRWDGKSTSTEIVGNLDLGNEEPPALIQVEAMAVINRQVTLLLDDETFIMFRLSKINSQ